MRANRMGRWQGLGLYRAHLLEMHLENSSMDGTRDHFYLVRTVVHISHGSCTEHDTHIQTWICLPLSPARVSFNLLASPFLSWDCDSRSCCAPRVPRGTRWGKWPQWVIDPSDRAHFPSATSCWTSSPDASLHLCHHDTMISFTHFENDICCWYDVKLPSIYNIEIPAFPTITSLVPWNSLFPGIWLCLTFLFSIWPLVQNVQWKNNTKIEKLKTK